MLRRVSLLLASGALALTMIMPANAYSLLIAQKSSSQSGSVNLLAGLVPGRQYKVNVKSNGHRSFVIDGYENFTFVSNHHLFSGNKGLHFKGTTPHAFTLQVPRSGMKQWLLGVSAQLLRGRGITVQLIDIGKGH